MTARIPRLALPLWLATTGALGAAACTSQSAAVLLGPADAASPPTSGGAPGTGGATGAGGVSATGGTAGSGGSSSTGTATAPQGDELFRDGFDRGYERWLLSGSEDTDGPVGTGVEGDNPFVTLDASAHDFSRLRCNLRGELFPNVDVTAAMRFRVDQAPSSTRTVRLDARQAAHTENIFYAVGATIATDGSTTKIGIFKKVDDGDGNYTICALAQTSLDAPVAMGEWRSLKLAVSGTERVRLVGLYDDVALVSYEDDCASSLVSTAGLTVPNGGCLADQTAIGIQVEKGLKASVDDVAVTRL